MRIPFIFGASLLSLLLTITPKVTLAQADTTTKDEGRYQKFVGAKEKVIKEAYDMLITQKPNGKYVKRVFYPDPILMTEEYECTDSNGYHIEGPAKYWHETGFLQSMGNFKNNRPDGTWKYYYRHLDAISKEGKYDLGKRTGPWTTYHKSGKKSSEYHYEHGDLEGNFVLYDSLGVVINKGVFHADTLFEQMTIIKDMVDEMPYLLKCEEVAKKSTRMDPCSLKAFIRSIYRNVEYPEAAMDLGLKGRTVSRFTIGPNGKIKNYEVIVALNGFFKAELNRIFLKLQREQVWVPGIKDGKKVDVQFTIPVKFQLE